MPSHLGRLLTKISLPVCQERSSGDVREKIRAKCCSAFAGILAFVCLGTIVMVAMGGIWSGNGECTRQYPQKIFFHTPNSFARSSAIKDISHMRKYANKCTRLFDMQAAPDGAKKHSKTTRAYRLRTALLAPAEVRVGLIAQQMM